MHKTIQPIVKDLDNLSKAGPEMIPGCLWWCIILSAFAVFWAP